MAPEEPVALAVILAGRFSVGAVVSTTCTVNVVGVAAFPFESVALHVTVVLPNTKFEPEASKQEAVLGPSNASEVAGLV